MKAYILNSINEIKREDWDLLNFSEYPFLKYEFLKALETSGCASIESGWTPFHLILKSHEETIGVMPLYIKDHSQGEFIFDWSWADAYYRNGLNYYPKLVSSIPFTPATGPRLLLKNPDMYQEAAQVIKKKLVGICNDHDLSSFHILLPSDEQKDKLYLKDFSIRSSYSFHWFNNNYESFDSFLDDMTSRQRKNIKKERGKIKEQDIRVVRLRGDEVSSKQIEQFYNFYQITYLKRGMRGYLNKDFFIEIFKKIPESILLVLAENFGGDLVAGALNFYDSESLYGRYWGCLEEYNSLHFEVCYYQGIEFCINEKILKFDPGVQGEHKIKRGFCPIETYSLHWIKDKRFRVAINDFVEKEKKHIKNYSAKCKELLPFKKELMNKFYEK